LCSESSISHDATSDAERDDENPPEPPENDGSRSPTKHAVVVVVVVVVVVAIVDVVIVVLLTTLFIVTNLFITISVLIGMIQRRLPVNIMFKTACLNVRAICRS
jgi:Flp pilus assembly protein TadB